MGWSACNSLRRMANRSSPALWGRGEWGGGRQPPGSVPPGALCQPHLAAPSEGELTFSVGAPIQQRGPCDPILPPQIPPLQDISRLSRSVPMLRCLQNLAPCLRDTDTAALSNLGGSLRQQQLSLPWGTGGICPVVVPIICTHAYSGNLWA